MLQYRRVAFWPPSRGGRACLPAFHGEIDYFDYPLGDKLSLEVSVRFDGPDMEEVWWKHFETVARIAETGRVI
ncbi:uncharacterized protein N7525_005459 [Penicillium rubens]|jgi:hypothetical protein|uniref:uncharacterized protein n=1 Tax=Penicillium rubens TaxID=1108849 RepID=UPI002A59B9D0|nr:uncharacterized protein N7525_005459 [Penicillium rubens]KAJ5840271.1 hypothetical protein N7525_005459 [Penicillium rubens]